MLKVLSSMLILTGCIWALCVLLILLLATRRTFGAWDDTAYWHLQSCWKYLWKSASGYYFMNTMLWWFRWDRNHQEGRYVFIRDAQQIHVTELNHHSGVDNRRDSQCFNLLLWWHRVDFWMGTCVHLGLVFYVKDNWNAFDEDVDTPFLRIRQLLKTASNEYIEDAQQDHVIGINHIFRRRYPQRWSVFYLVTSVISSFFGYSSFIAWDFLRHFYYLGEVVSCRWLSVWGEATKASRCEGSSSDDDSGASDALVVKV